MIIALSTLFTATAIASSFDSQAADQAAKGKTYAPLLTMLDGAYGLQIPAATAAAVRYVNDNLLTLEAAPKLAKGVGARAAVVTVTQALHAYMTAIVAGMHADTLIKLGPAFGVKPLPAWADPVQIAAKKAAKKDEREAKKADTPAESAESDPIEAAISAPAVDIAAQAREAWAKFAAFLDAGALTVAERDAYIEALSTCVTRAETVTKPEVKAAKTARKARAKAQAVEQKAADALNVQAIAADLAAKAEAAATEDAASA